MDRQNQFLDLSGDFVASFDPDYRIEYINSSGRKLLEIDPEHDLKLAPLNIRDFCTEDAWQQLSVEILPQVVVSGSWSGVVNLRSRSGREVPVSLRILAHRDEQGQISGLTGIGQDQHLRRALQTQEAMAERILDSTIEGIIVTDANARIQRVNAAFTQITGYPAEEVIGKTPKLLRSRYHGPSFYEAMDMALKKRGRWQGEIWNRRKNGEVYLQWMSISAIRDEQGRIVNFVSIFHDLTEIRAKEARIEELAFTDPLTGTGNRHKFIQTLTDLLKLQRKNPSPQELNLALLCIDIGQLSPINDRFGMNGGDQVIKYQVSRLQHHLGDQLSLYRLTGDELVAIISNPTDLTSVARCASECIEQLQTPLFLEGESIRMSPSVGLAISPKDGQEADTLLSCAQTAMLSAKQAGRDHYRFYDETLSDELRQRLILEQQLRLAVQHDMGLGLELYLQPKVNLEDHRLTGGEVLLRWRHPDRGMISPAEFIPLAEESRLIVTLDRWVFRRSCALLQQWRDRMAELPRLSINLSGRQLQEPDLAEWYVNTVQQYGLNAQQLELEVTETAFINLADGVMEQLTRLREAGFSLALDDFGTGYSSLTYLRRLSLDVVKIDRSFVADLCTDARAATLLKGVMQLLSELDLHVVAEGIETDEQARLLRSIGCMSGQGYLYYKPIPATEFMQLYSNRA